MPSGYWSGFFDGTGDYLSIADNAAFDFAASDFTVETWVNFSALPAASNAACFVSQWPSSSRGWFFYLFNSAGTYQLYLTYSTNGSGQTNLSVNLASAPTIGTWNHVAFVRSGNNFLVFWNGTQVGSTQTLSATIFNSTGNIVVGAQIETTLPDYLLVGYQSNLRIVKGTAVYTAAFTPPTTPLTAITNTSLLCLQDNRFKDNSTNAFAITVNGDTRISKFAPFNPPASYSTASYGGSGYFDGTGDYLSVPDNAAWDFGTGDFTIEAWYYPTTSNAQQIIVGQWDGVGGGSGLAWVLFTSNNSSRFLRAATSSNGSTVLFDLVSTSALDLNAWNHVAFVRSGTTFQLYLNGAAAGSGSTTSSSALANATNALTIGASSGGTQPATGYISNVRLVKGTAVYTAAFTPPTTPLTAITNTSLLLNFTNAGIFDAATINDGQTVGNAQVSTTQAKWSPTSMAFDGTGDYLTVIDKPELRFGTGNFTVEFWVYFPSTSPAATFIEKGTGAEWGISVNPGGGGSGTFPLLFRWASTGSNLTGQITANAWTHVAIVREGTGTNQTKFYIGGTNTDTLTVSTNFNQTGTLFVGARSGGSEPLNGYIQDVRITNGYARYTANFTAPTAAFPTL
jgi:hypothetical protein